MAASSESPRRPWTAATVGLLLLAGLGLWLAQTDEPRPAVESDPPAAAPEPTEPATVSEPAPEVAPGPERPAATKAPSAAEPVPEEPLDSGDWLLDPHPEPQIWHEGWPSHLAPPRFGQLAENAVENCEMPVHYGGAVCDEAPCYAVLGISREDHDGDWGALYAFVDECDGWGASFGTTVDRWTRCSRAVTCPDGSEEWLLLLTSEEALAYMELPGEAAQEAAKARQQERCDEVRSTWTCGM